MKILTLCTMSACATLTLAQPTTSTSPAPAAASDVAPLSAALRHYLIGYTAASFEAVVVLTETQQSSNVLASVEMQIKILESEPTDKLPADIQSYILEGLAISKSACTEMKSIVERTQKNDMQHLGQNFDRMKMQLRALGEKYPAAHHFLTETSVVDQLIMREMGFQQKFDDLMKIKLPEHNNDLVQAISSVFGILAKELRAIQQ